MAIEPLYYMFFYLLNECIGRTFFFLEHLIQLLNRLFEFFVFCMVFVVIRITDFFLKCFFIAKVCVCVLGKVV